MEKDGPPYISKILMPSKRLLQLPQDAFARGEAESLSDLVSLALQFLFVNPSLEQIGHSNVK